MNVTTTKSLVFKVLILPIMLVACTQTPNYAPVKAVNQALEPDNGFPSKNLPSKPRTNPESAKESGNTAKKQQQHPNVPKSSHHPSPKSAVKKSLERTANTRNSAENPEIRNSTAPKPEKPKPSNEKPTLTLAIKADTKQQKSKASDQHPDTNRANPRANTTNPNAPTLPKNKAHDLEVATQKISDEKNIKEKKSTISIDNKKMLKLNFQLPVQGKISKNFSQTDNKGIDITGQSGQAVRAAEAGKVVYCGHGLVGYGNLVIIKHDDTYLSAYANNSSLAIKEGQHVEKGQTIGQVGSVGSKKASLHFEIRKNGKSINPLTMLPKH